jgi:hypothetical protein
LVSDIASLDVQIAVATTIGDETRVATLREQRAQASTRLQTFTGPDLGVAR